MADKLTKKVLTRVALCLIIPTFLGIVIYFDYSHFVNQFQVLQLDFKDYSKESNILLKLNDLSIIHGIQYIYQKSDPIELLTTCSSLKYQRSQSLFLMF